MSTITFSDHSAIIKPYIFADQVSYNLSLRGSSQESGSAKIVLSCVSVNVLEAINDIVNDAQVSTLTTPSGLDEAGHAVAGASTLASSDSFTTVLGYVEGIVRIGDAIAGVSFTHSRSLR